jgi:hypothetical protein
VTYNPSDSSAVFPIDSRGKVDRMVDKPGMNVMDEAHTIIEAISEDGSKRSIAGSFKVLNANRLTLSVKEAVAANYAPRVEYEDVLPLSEVPWCKPDGNGSFEIYMEVEPTLTILQGLTAMRDPLSSAAVHQGLAALQEFK